MTVPFSGEMARWAADELIDGNEVSVVRAQRTAASEEVWLSDGIR